VLSTPSVHFFAPLRPRPHQVLWLVYGLFLVAGIAQAAIVPLLPRLSNLYSLSPSATALLLALPGLATLVVSVPAGLVADRFGARRATLTAGVLLGLSCLAQALASLPILFAGRIVFGMAFGVVWTTGVAWLAEIDTPDGGSRIGPSVTCSSVGVMLGPAVGGALAQMTGVEVPFLMIAVVVAAVVTPLALARPMPCAASPAAEPTSHAAVTATPNAPVRTTPDTSPRSLLALLRRPGVGAAAGGLAVSGAVSGVSQLLITAGLHGDGLSSSRIGLAFSAAAVLYIAASALTVKIGARARTLRANAVATGLLAIALLPALAGGGTAPLVAALLLASVPRAAISTIAYPLASDPALAAGGDGFVFGMLNGAWAGAMVLAPLVAGALEQGDGASAGFLAVVVPSMAIAAWLLVGARRQAAGRRSVPALVPEAAQCSSEPVRASTTPSPPTACRRRSSCRGMWQRIPWPASSSRSSGSVVSQISPILRGHRVWKGQPVGGSAADGISPSRRMRRRSESASVGTADRSASV
jgi:MFS family permease